MVDYSKSITTPSFAQRKISTHPRHRLPPTEKNRSAFFFLFALAEHSLSFTGRRMFAGSFDGVRPCSGRDGVAARRKDERRDNLHPQEQEGLGKEVLHGVFLKKKTERSDPVKNKCRQ